MWTLLEAAAGDIEAAATLSKLCQSVTSMLSRWLWFE